MIKSFIITALTRLFIVVGVSLTLSACEGLFGDIDQNKIGIFTRNSDVLRLYQDGDYMVYNVYGEDLNASDGINFFQGTIRVQWDQALITPPAFTNPVQALSVLKETTTLSILGGADYTSIRYITQENNDLFPDPLNPNPLLGSIRVHAFNDPQPASVNTYYWVNNADPSTYLDVIESVITFHSPVIQDATTPDDDILFNVMASCDNAIQCGSRAQYVLLGSREYRGISADIVETELGIFSQLSKIVYNDDVFTVDSNIAQPTLVNVNGFCDSSLQRPVASGSLWIHPEIGVVKMENTCTAGFENKRFSATIRETNIPLPELIVN